MLDLKTLVNASCSSTEITEDALFWFSILFIPFTAFLSSGVQIAACMVSTPFRDNFPEITIWVNMEKYYTKNSV